MDERTLGVDTSPSLHHDWLTLARQAGVRPTRWLLRQPVLPRWQPAGWLVVLDPRQPVPLACWLQQPGR
jgi:hypothetical protein